MAQVAVAQQSAQSSKFENVYYLSAEKTAKSGKQYRGVATIKDGKFEWKNQLVAFVCKNGGISIVKTA